MPETLKPCPFCASKDVEIYTDDVPYFFCQSCDAQGPRIEGATDIAASWNARPVEEALVEAIEALCINLKEMPENVWVEDCLSRAKAAIKEAKGG